MIPRLEKGQDVNAQMDLRVKPAGTYFEDFEKLLRLESENPSEDQNFEIRVPMVVQFCDSSKNLYETKHEVVYNVFSRVANIRLVAGTSLVRIA